MIRRFLLAQGLPEGRVLLEDRATSTRQNALFSLPLARPQPGERWLLVTSAMHMPRSIGVFRGAGWPSSIPGRSTTAPRAAWSCRRSRSWPAGSTSSTRPPTSGTGLAYYRLLGYTGSLFPGPAP